MNYVNNRSRVTILFNGTSQNCKTCVSILDCQVAQKKHSRTLFISDHSGIANLNVHRNDASIMKRMNYDNNKVERVIIISRRTS